MIRLLIYDVTSDKLRKKLSDQLLAIGFERIQLSVFLGKVKRNHLDRIIKFARQHMEPTDKLYILALDEDQVDGMQVVGEKPDFDMILGRIHTLFL